MSELMLNLLSRPDGPFVRGMIAPSGMQEYSVYDTLNIACAYKKGGSAARQEFSQLIKEGSQFRDEVVSMTDYLKFPGSGQRETPA